MASVLDHRHPKHCFPLSPPSSTTVSAHSSPQHSPTLDPFSSRLFPSSSFRQSHSLASVRSGKNRAISNGSESDGYNTEKSPSRATRQPSSRRAMPRALTLPPGSISPTKHALQRSPVKFPRPLARTSSMSSSASSSSTPTDGEASSIPHPSTGMGRKVAASLQLFKETTALSEENAAREPSTSRESLVGLRRQEPFPDVEDVPEAFEFVKRSEWPDRESAAMRRDKSIPTLERVKTRESDHQSAPERKASSRESAMVDVAQWRRDLPVGRGRRRERATDDLCDPDPRSEVPLSSINNFHETSPIYIRPRSRAYPPSPSPSRSPTNRSSRHLPETPISLPPIKTTPRNSRSPTPVRTSHHPESYSAPISPLETVSPWSTDDESAWESASVTSTAASNASTFAQTDAEDHPSAASFSESSAGFLRVQNHSLSMDGGELLNSAPLKSIDDDTLALDLNISEERLPHIPLRPFRNQVGGHSAIYKFTKQAVCKVRRNIMSLVSFR